MSLLSEVGRQFLNQAQCPQIYLLFFYGVPQLVLVTQTSHLPLVIVWIYFECPFPCSFISLGFYIDYKVEKSPPTGRVKVRKNIRIAVKILHIELIIYCKRSLYLHSFLQQENIEIKILSINQQFFQLQFYFKYLDDQRNLLYRQPSALHLLTHK